MTPHTPEERKAFKALEQIADELADRTDINMLQNLTNAVMAQTQVMERIADALETGTLSGVVNLIDALDTNLGHHLGGIQKEIEESSQNIANQVAGLSGGMAAQLRQVIDAIASR